MSRSPWMVVSALLDPAVRAEFDDWHATVHVPRVLAIPGITGGLPLINPTATANYAMIYFFESDEALRSALASPEAGEARRDWERWAEHMRDLTVTFFDEYQPARLYLRLN